MPTANCYNELCAVVVKTNKPIKEALKGATLHAQRFHEYN